MKLSSVRWNINNICRDLEPGANLDICRGTTIFFNGLTGWVGGLNCQGRVTNIINNFVDRKVSVGSSTLEVGPLEIYIFFVAFLYRENH